MDDRDHCRVPNGQRAKRWGHRRTAVRELHDGQAETPLAGPTKADPEIRQEIARLEHAITTANRQLLRAAGGFNKASDRLVYLQALPEGTSTKAHRRAAIDRFSTWNTARLISPAAAF